MIINLLLSAWALKRAVSLITIPGEIIEFLTSRSMEYEQEERETERELSVQLVADGERIFEGIRLPRHLVAKERRLKAYKDTIFLLSERELVIFERVVKAIDSGKYTKIDWKLFAEFKRVSESRQNNKDFMRGLENLEES